MPNPNYIKGRKKEYKIVKELREKGFEIVQRSAGSHSPVDVFAIHREKRLILFVQVKPWNIRNKNRELIYKKQSWLNGEFKTKFEVM